MKPSDLKDIEKAADDAIALMRKARLATNQVADNINAAAASAILTTSLTQSVDAHTEALEAAKKLADRAQAAGIPSITNSMPSVLKRVEEAQRAMEQLKTNPVVANADKARDADDEAIKQLQDAKAAVQYAPEIKVSEPTRWAWLSQIPYKAVGGILVGVVIIFITVIGLYHVGSGISGKGPLLDNLSRTEYARGLITFLLGVGTIFIAVLLVVAALLGDGGEESDRKFGRGKEVLTVLVGIFGTILGFYFGSEKLEQKAKLELSPVSAVRVDATTAKVAAAVSGGKPPYMYSISFKESGISSIKDANSANGRIEAIITNVPTNKTASYTLTVIDANKVRIDHESAEPEQIPQK